ncbi:MAG TPA: hypothetical protein VFK02_32760 [Kofleriaceae bacterium]|nr:hypothetical protein [Kofleriaceae bacterium]
MRIESVDKATRKVTFSAKGSRKLHTVQWGEPDVWVECPTTVASPPGGLPEPRAEGVLYVGSGMTHTLDHAARQFLRLKWPEEAAMDVAPGTTGALPYSAIPLSVSSIRIRATVANQPGEITFDVLEPGSPNAGLDLSGVYSLLHVRDHATDTFHPVEMKVTRALIHATCLPTGISSKLDLLDPALSDAFQVLALEDRSQIKVRLSQRGAALFGIGSHP